MKEVLRLDHGVLTHFPASAGRNKPALILCPGGGYEYCSIREGAPVARAFARDGVEAFVLEYDCMEVPLGVKPLHTLSASVAAYSGNIASSAAPVRIVFIIAIISILWRRPYDHRQLL